MRIKAVHFFLLAGIICSMPSTSFASDCSVTGSDNYGITKKRCRIVTQASSQSDALTKWSLASSEDLLTVCSSGSVVQANTSYKAYQPKQDAPDSESSWIVAGHLNVDCYGSETSASAN